MKLNIIIEVKDSGKKERNNVAENKLSPFKFVVVYIVRKKCTEFAYVKRLI